ncbi:MULTISPECIES: RNA polymerase sigma factor [unclassified Nocardiopsis]|uniref:RNA polymerase sigma factor n=1 Tax=unclassified Nocardiopsis TaxID=2649073 RepID=UPI001F3271F6|nr:MULTISPECIES: sigma-70 family RNA polymerase sigma factor [unclassified Nocardiopsis]
MSGRNGPAPLPPAPDDSPGDAELVRRACLGERRAWEAIVDRHLPVVNAIARSYRLSAPDREDAVQTVWLTLNQHLPRLRSPASLRGWLRRVTRDVCARQRRQSERLRPVDPGRLESSGQVPGPESEYLHKERHEELHRAIGRLVDPGERRAALRYLDEEAGTGEDRTDPGEAANSRRRMIRRLRRILEEPT